MWARQGTVLSVRHLTEAIISCIISLAGERREYHFVVPLIRFLTLFCKYPIMISCECGGTAYTADLKSAGESLRVQIPPFAPRKYPKSLRISGFIVSEVPTNSDTFLWGWPFYAGVNEYEYPYTLNDIWQNVIASTPQDTISNFAGLKGFFYNIIID